MHLCAHETRLPGRRSAPDGSGAAIRVAALLVGVAVAIALVAAAVQHGSGAAAAAASPGASALSVDLTVRERLGVARRGEVVTSGIPIARGAALLSTADLRVLDATGDPVPAQFAVTARWGGAPDDPRLPIRWVLVDFVATAPADAAARYRLVADGAVASPPGAVAVTRSDDDALAIDTGAARFTIDKRRFDLLASAIVGGQELVRRGARSGISATTPLGAVFASTVEPPRSVTVETAGAVRTTVRVAGRLASGAGGRLLDYTARLSFFSGRSDVRVLLTVRNPSEPVVNGGQPQVWFIGSPSSAIFADLSVHLGGAAGDRPRLRLGGVPGRTFTATGGALEVYQDSSGSAFWDRHRGSQPRPQSYVSFRGYRVYRNGGIAFSGTQIQPWLSCSGASGGLAVVTRDFWQQFPKALRGAPDLLSVGLLPREYAGDFSFRPGEQKTHELALIFHRPAATAAAVRGMVAAGQEPLFAEAPRGYYLASGALGRVAPLTDDAEAADYEALDRNTIAGAGANLPRVIREADFTGWQDYGEAPVDYEDGGTGTLNHKYNFDYGMLLQWMRSGDRAWFDLAEAGGRHIADLDVLHSSGAPDDWWDGGFFGHSYHDENSNGNPNRNEGGLHPDLVFGTPGLLLLYHLTGYEPAREAALEIADNTRYRFDNSFGRGNGEGYAEAWDDENECYTARSFAHGLWVLIEAYRATGDEGYLDTAAWVVEKSRLAVDSFICDPVPGDRRFTKLFQWDLLELALGKYLDLLTETGRSDDVGARDQLLAMTHQEAYVMWNTDAAGNEGVPYAWMRDGSGWGWEDREVPVNISNWQLLTADALAYGYVYGGDPLLLERARAAFKTGSSPDVEYYRPVYTATKEATNSANFGLVYLLER